MGRGRDHSGSRPRPISRLERLSDYPRLCERIRTLAQEEFRSPKQAKPFSRQAVVASMRRLEVHQPRSRRRLPLSPHEWWLSDLARVLAA
jgi:hypothetical protein